MPELPELLEIQLTAEHDYPYDFVQAGRIVKAMDYLRREAVNTGIEEVVTMVDATYSVLATGYHCLLRSEKMPQLAKLDIAKEWQGYDFARMEQILSALNFLRQQAVETGISEIVTMIDACFRLLVTTYYCVLYYEMPHLSGAEVPDQ
jgi:hypothetical protein